MAFRRRSARLAEELFGLGDATDLPPFVGLTFVFRGAIGEPEQIRSTKFCVAGTATFDFDKTERFHLAKSGPDGMVVNAEFNQIGMGDGQLTVIFSAVGCEFDFNAIKDAISACCFCFSLIFSGV